MNNKTFYISHFRALFYHYGSFVPTMKSSALFQDGPKEFGPYAVVWDWRPHRVPIVPEMTQLVIRWKTFWRQWQPILLSTTNELPLLWWRTKIFLLLGAFHLLNKRKKLEVCSQYLKIFSLGVLNLSNQIKFYIYSLFMGYRALNSIGWFLLCIFLWEIPAIDVINGSQF